MRSDEAIVFNESQIDTGTPADAREELASFIQKRRPNWKVDSDSKQ